MQLQILDAQGVIMARENIEGMLWVSRGDWLVSAYEVAMPVVYEGTPEFIRIVDSKSKVRAHGPFKAVKGHANVGERIIVAPANILLQVNCSNA